jgi:hypothetical protein
MAESINPTSFPAAEALDGSEVIPIHQPTGWKSVTLAIIKTWLAGYFAPVGDGAEAVAAHNMVLDPHTQYVLQTDLPALITPPPNDDNFYLLRNGQWEVLNIS